MNDSPIQSDSLNGLVKSDDPYYLLHCYAREAKIQSKAYGYSEGYYRWLYKCLTYPLVILSAVNTVLAGFHIDEYALMAISFATLILVGFNQAVAPKDKEHSANQVKTEFGEIASDCKQFIYSNNRTKNEVKAYTETIHELINTWTALSPPIQQKFLTQAKKECAQRSRKHKRGGSVGTKKKVGSPTRDIMHLSNIQIDT